MEKKLKKIAGQQLQLLRLERNLTQEQMGEKLNLSTSAYCKIEYGETDLTLTRLYKIAQALDISFMDLLARIDNYTDTDSYYKKNNSANNVLNNNDPESYNTLYELVKANCRTIDLLCKRIEQLEQRK